MEHINGTTNPKPIVISPLTEESERKAVQKPKQRPAHTLQNGRVVTRIWANRTHWGAIEWRVDHYALNPFADGGKQFSLERGDLWDAMRGIYQAHRWIKRTEKRRRSYWR